MRSSRDANQAGIWRLKTRLLKAVSKEVVYVNDRRIRANTPKAVLEVSSKCARTNGITGILTSPGIGRNDLYRVGPPPHGSVLSLTSWLAGLGGEARVRYGNKRRIEALIQRNGGLVNYLIEQFMKL